MKFALIRADKLLIKSEMSINYQMSLGLFPTNY